MARLPQSGTDEGIWGDVLNDYLLTEHNPDGSHDTAKILQTPPDVGLILASDPTAPGGFSWQDARSLMPEEGTSDQVLMRVSDDQNECAWRDITKETIGLGNVTDDLQLRAADLDTDPLLAAASDTKIASQKAVKQYVDGKMGSPLTLSPATPTNGTTLLYFNTERQWQFRQKGAGSVAQLELNSVVDIKSFVVTSPAGVAALSVNVADNPNSSSVAVTNNLSVGGAVTVSGTATLSGGIITKRTPVSNANYIVAATDHIIAYTSLSAPRTVTLPSGQLAGKTYIIKDESGQAGTHAITVVASGSTIDGAASKAITTNFGSLKIYYNGANWFIIA